MSKRKHVKVRRITIDHNLGGMVRVFLVDDKGRVWYQGLSGDWYQLPMPNEPRESPEEGMPGSRKPEDE